MSMLKSYLKAARQAISDNDPDNAIYQCDSVIDGIDSENFLAHVLKGKALQMLKREDKALACYEKATKIDPTSIVPLKGMLSITREKLDYKAFYSVLEKMVALDNSQMTLQEVSKEMRKYYTKNGRKIEELKEFHLRNLLPGTPLGDAVGELTQPVKITLNDLVQTVRNQETAARTADVRKQQMKTPSNPTVVDLEKLDAVAWSHYAKSDLADLLERLLNLTSDKKRYELEKELFKYKLDRLQVAPQDMKKPLRDDVYDMAAGLVTVKRNFPSAYKVFFDWSDYETINDLDLNEVVSLVKNSTAGFNGVLYAFILSEMSPFSTEVIKSKLENRKKRRGKPKDEENDISLSAEDVASFMSKAISEGCMLAFRIAIAYYINQKEYEVALDNIHAAMKLLSTNKRLTGLQFPNTRRDLLLSLATVYTYHESPKNFGKALQIYDSILLQYPDDAKATIGKALIILEREQYTEAFSLLEEVITRSPDNLEALMAKSWAQIKLGQFAEGRVGLQSLLERAETLSSIDSEFKAKAYHRLGESYMMEISKETNDISEAVAMAKSCFVKSLKEMQTYSPSYTSLGRLYFEYFNDHDRAIKCYYKALELDAGELEAAREIASIFSDKMEWEIVKVICERVLSSESARHRLSTVKDPSWPYRGLGCACLESQDDVGAIEHFQNGLRLFPGDVASWIGLGEAYFSRGRIEASSKVFQKALELNPESWQANYMLAMVQASLGNFEDSIEIFDKLTKKNPDDLAIVIGASQVLVSKSHMELARGFTGRAADSANKAIKLITSALEIDFNSQKLWALLCSCIRIIITLQSLIKDAPLQDIYDAIKADEKLESEMFTFDARDMFESEDAVEFAFGLLIYSSLKALLNGESNSAKLLRSSLYYNVGLAFSEAYFTLADRSDVMNAMSVKALKKAIELEPSNADYWTALGNVSASKNAKISQHCYIKASALSPRDPTIWSNLAFLSLKYGDMEMAKNAFARAQSIAPENGTSWTGNALIAEANGDHKLSKGLFTHSMVLSNGRNPLSMLLYGLSVARDLTASSSESPSVIQEVNFASFSMISYLKYHPSDKLALTLTVTIIERIKDYMQGITLSKQLIELLENAYNKNEDDTILASIAETRALLSRLYLGNGDFELALEEAEASLDTLQMAEVETARVVLSAYSVKGLALFFLEQYSESLEQFKLCLDLSSNSSQIVVLISQILCMFNEEDTTQAAIDELFQSIETNGTSLLVLVTLAAISIVQNYEDYMVAIKDEFESLSLTMLIQDKARHVPELVAEINKRCAKPEHTFQRFAFMFPNDVKLWTKLDASMAETATVGDKATTSAQLASVLTNTGSLREIQRGLFLNPRSPAGYKALQGCT